MDLLPYLDMTEKRKYLTSIINSILSTWLCEICSSLNLRKGRSPMSERGAKRKALGLCTCRTSCTLDQHLVSRSRLDRVPDSSILLHGFSLTTKVHHAMCTKVVLAYKMRIMRSFTPGDLEEYRKASDDERFDDDADCDYS